VSEDRLRILACRIGRCHPLFSLAERAIAAYPARTAEIALAAADWAAYAGTHGRDPFTLDRADFDAIIASRRGHTQYVRRVGLPLLWETLDPDGSTEDALAGLRIFDQRAAAEKRLTRDEHARVVADAIRDLRNESRRIAAARDLLAIGLLGNATMDLEEMGRLRRSDLHNAGGYLQADAGRLSVGQDVLMPAGVLRALLERLLGPLRDEDALVPSVGTQHLRAYRRDDRTDMVPTEPMVLWRHLGGRLRRAGVALTFGSRTWASPTWFAGVSDGTFRLPPDLALTLTPTRAA
jgi:hypothetical protein